MFSTVNKDINLLVYKEPDGTPVTCCSSCFDKMVTAHQRLVKNIRWTAFQDKEMRKEKRGKRKANANYKRASYYWSTGKIEY